MITPFTLLQGFLTGSRAYGTPKPESDVDIVLRVPQSFVDMLLAIVPSEKVRHHPQNDSVSFWCGDLNLICITSDEVFATWAVGTHELVQIAPVTREDAIEAFNKKGIAKSFTSQDPSLTEKVVPEKPAEIFF